MRLDQVDPGTGPSGVVWSAPPGDLNVNLVVLAAGDAVAPHRNDDLDVLVVAVAGRGVLTVGDDARELVAPEAVLVPKGTVRTVRAEPGGELRYLTVHRARPPMQIGSRSPAP